jgi:hypothetical protein
MFTETLIRIPLIVIGRFTPASTPHWLPLKCAEVYLSQAAFDIQIIDVQKSIHLMIQSISSHSFTMQNVLLWAV